MEFGTDAVVGFTVIVVSTGAGGGIAVTVTVALPTIVPFVAFIVVVPGLDAVNKPVTGSIVPTVVLLLLHVTVAAIEFPKLSLGMAANAAELPTIRDAVVGATVIVVNTGVTATDEVTTSVALPTTLPFVAFMVVVPAEDAKNRPVIGSIVPTVLLLLFHVKVADVTFPSWSKPIAVNVAELPAFRDNVAGNTEIAVSTGGTVTVAVALPTTVPFVAFIVVVPGFNAANDPLTGSIVPTVVLLLFHVTVAAIGFPS